MRTHPLQIESHQRYVMDQDSVEDLHGYTLRKRKLKASGKLTFNLMNHGKTSRVDVLINSQIHG